MTLLCAGAVFKLPTDLGGDPVWVLLDLTLIAFTAAVLIFDIATVVRSRRDRRRSLGRG
jgi:hypothetical protein